PALEPALEPARTLPGPSRGSSGARPALCGSERPRGSPCCRLHLSSSQTPRRIPYEEAVVQEFGPAQVGESVGPT
uniref:Uncharacterized protein n=1 Tax=Taeniopygia guttata TaxID=59729 RepID=A0A674HM19_TAEGU